MSEVILIAALLIWAWVILVGVVWVVAGIGALLYHAISGIIRLFRRGSK